MTDPLLDPLNEVQRAVVTHGDGPLLVLAGAGSGKTRTVTHRIAYLIREGRAAASQIAAVTFTKKAAAEMRDRALELTGLSGRGRLWVSTFHSLCAYLLRSFNAATYLKQNFTIYDRDDQKRLLKPLVTEDTGYSLNDYLDYISRCKEQLRAPGETRDGNEREEAYCLYQKALERSNAVDFGGLLMETVQLLERDRTARDQVQQRWHYLFVDEFQDTNPAQLRLCILLAEARRNICVVGDDDQSIYSWRGARIENILEFDRHFEDAAVYKLEQNYRSSGNILFAASEVVRCNRGRHEKSLWCSGEDGAPVTLYFPPDPREEAAFICDVVEKTITQAGGRYSDFAVFYRTNAQSRILEDTLRRRRLPFRIFGGVRFYERVEVKDILAYIKLLVNPSDEIAFLRIINTPTRKIGKQTVDRIMETARREGNTPLTTLRRMVNDAVFKGAKHNALAAFVALIDTLQVDITTAPVTQVYDRVMTQTNYFAWVRRKFPEQFQERLENIEELLAVMNDFENGHDEPTAGAFLEELVLNEDVSRDEDRPDDFVSLMTLHSAKGLEYDNVFIVGLCDGLLPHFASSDSHEEVEEERRLFYVGMTRARSNLFITSPHTRQQRGFESMASQSPFLREIPEEVLNTIGTPPGRDHPVDPWDF